MQLFIVRHAEAVPLGDADVPFDFDRPLTARGVRQAENLGRAMCRMSVEFNLILTSPAKRALHTAQIVAAEMEIPNRLIECEGLWTGELKSLHHAIQRHQPEYVCIIGHEPFLGELTGNLISGLHSLRVPLKKAGLAMIDIPFLPSRHLGLLRWALTPNQLSLIAHNNNPDLDLD